MPRALWKLMRLRARGALRRIFRNLKTARGILFFIIAITLVALWVVSAILGGVVGGRTPVESVRQAAPLAMLGMTLLMLVFTGGKAISFTAAEMDFLFSGPFSRRHLVLYKVVTTAIGAVIVSLVFSLWMWRHSSMWIAAFLGAWFTWLLAQSLAMTLLVAKQAVIERAGPAALRLLMGAVLVVAAAGAVQIAMPLLSDSFDLAALAAHARESLAGRMVLAPFQAMTQVFTAQRVFPDLLQWSALAAAECGLVVGLLLMLDGYFVETSIAASQALHAKIKRMRRSGGGVMALGASRGASRWRVPMLPWLGGAGPVAWRQLTIALRSSRGLLLVLFLMVLGLAPALLVVGRNHTGAMAPILIGPAFWLTLMLPNMLRLDFRGDLQHMDELKALPMRAWAVSLGQILAPVLVLTVVDGGLVAIAAAMIEAARPWLLAAAAFIVPLNLLLVGLENIMFLTFPTRQMMATPGDFQMIGRGVVVSLLKMLCLLAALGVAAGAGGTLWLLTDDWMLTAIAAWLALAAMAAATLPVIARLFARFDPSVDTPA